MAVAFEVLRQDGRARRGRLTTPHGVIETPAFAPVGTLGAVKGVTPVELERLGADLMLANLYHLALRPGVDAISELGGIHRFTGWPHSVLTDSGGFQVFSLARLRSIDDEGVTFRSHLDGSKVRFTPEWVADAQSRMGVDLAMMLDECPPWPIEHRLAAVALERTIGWARRARQVWEGDGAFFAIAQGGIFEDLRYRAVAALTGLDFDGYAIGGVSVGEPLADRRRVVEWTAPALPEDKPRYLMGVGTPSDLLHAVSQGVDLFDCVLPSRNARHGQLFTHDGVVRIKNARHRGDPRPLDPDCECPACRRCSRAFLHHLYRSGEMTGPVLGTLHNLRFYLDFVGQLREATSAGNLAEHVSRASEIWAIEDGPAGDSETVPLKRPHEAGSGSPAKTKGSGLKGAGLTGPSG